MRSRLTALAGEKRERSAGELVNQHNHSHAAAPTVEGGQLTKRDRRYEAPIKADWSEDGPCPLH